MQALDYRIPYEQWLALADPETKAELTSLDKEKEIEDRFYCDLAFGTGGIRGEMGAGTNRVNRYTIRKAAAGCALYLKSLDPGLDGKQKAGVIIGYDTRRGSLSFAMEAALTFCAFQIPVRLFDSPAPVPLLSFTLRKEKALCGVAVTASHNPANYNGFKIYNDKGGQLVPEEAAKIAPFIAMVDPFAVTPMEETKAKAEGLLRFTGQAERAAYLSAITRRKVKDSPLTVVATPLHGAAKDLLKTALIRAGHTVVPVPQQEICDGIFATVAVPNPEDPAVFALAEAAGYENNADLLCATDPDADRCGVSVLHQGRYIPLSGNEMGAILISYLLQRDKNRLPRDGYIVKTAVTGNLGEKIAAKYEIPTLVTPTGFKYIGEAMLRPENGTFLAGYEESGGFLAGDHAADKDGISTAVLLAEAAAAYKKRHKTLVDVLASLYAAYGYEYNETKTFRFPGKDGATRKAACLKFFQENKAAVGADQAKEIHGDTLVFTFGEKIRTALRPSGTEPKLKLYFTVEAENETAAKAAMAEVEAVFVPLIAGFLPEAAEETKTK